MMTGSKGPNEKVVLLAILSMIVLTTMPIAVLAGTTSDDLVSISIDGPTHVGEGEKFDLKLSVGSDTSKVYSVMSGRLFLDGNYLGFIWIFLDEDGGWERTLKDRTLEEGDHNYTFVVRYKPKGFGHRTNTIRSTLSITAGPLYCLGWLPPVSVQEEHNAGRTIPIKFNVTQDGEFVKDTSVIVKVMDDTGKEMFKATYGASKGMVTIKGENHYQVNWDSEKGDVGTFEISVSFSNGFEASKEISLR